MTPDARTTDVTCRYKLPYPIALLYKQVYSSHRPAAKLIFTFQLVEGIIRFLAFINLADAIALQASDKRVNDWFQKLVRPTMGSLLYIFRETTRFLKKKGDLFVPETVSLIESDNDDWENHADIIIKLRNRIIHDFRPVDDTAANDYNDSIRESLGLVLRSILFLSHYYREFSEK
ncbi:hypothetical protein ACFL27_05495 [candidate division CSSED10-310 bacterium]|uniref:DUF4145 domain-containing protein n=1 Tax=candidate division CSSED10-310 bacterium TaxID=2855610 RepID=A0ABV6YU85_UNCC1